MEMRHNTLLKTSLCAALLINLGLAKAAKPPGLPMDDDAVELTGWLHVEDYTMEDVVLEVEVNGTYQVARVSNTGRCNVMLPADSKATLRFEKPGHLPKEVVVDTRYVHDGDRGARTRHVKFAVILELERFMGGMTYAGPVGSIGFDAGGGCVAVAHDKSLVPAKRHTPMVF